MEIGKIGPAADQRKQRHLKTSTRHRIPPLHPIFPFPFHSSSYEHSFDASQHIQHIGRFRIDIHEVCDGAPKHTHYQRPINGSNMAGNEIDHVGQLANGVLAFRRNYAHGPRPTLLPSAPYTRMPLRSIIRLHATRPQLIEPSLGSQATDEPVLVPFRKAFPGSGSSSITRLQSGT
jgi:hypothetical protein